MFEGFLHLFSRRPWPEILRDAVDVVLVAFLLYRVLLSMRGTRAMQMGIGIGVMVLLYLGAKQFALTTLWHLLSWMLSSILLVAIVVFQNDLRRVLIRLGSQKWFWGSRKQESRFIEEVAAAVTELARHRMGAIIAFEQDANVLEFTKNEGILIDSIVSKELLVSLFVPESANKLHDGAILIRDLRIARAGLFLPMSETKIRDLSMGSRHRAAIALTEETDAVLVIVSEERGTISLCYNGDIVPHLDGASLKNALFEIFRMKNRSGKEKADLHALSTQTRPHIVSSTRRNSIPPPSLDETKRYSPTITVHTQPRKESYFKTAKMDLLTEFKDIISQKTSEEEKENDVPKANS